MKRLLPCLVLLGCASPRPVQHHEPLPTPAPTVSLVFEFKRVFGGHSSSSLFDDRVIDAALMRRVLLEPSIFDDTGGTRTVEAWTRHRLFEALGQRHALLIAPPLPATQDPRTPCPVGGCYSPTPSAVLRNVRFLSGQDEVKVRVEPPVNGHVTLALWENPRQPSMCDAAFKLKLGFVELQAVVTRSSDGAMAALINELVLLEAPTPNTSITADAPSPSDTPAFCAFVAELFERDPGFPRDDGRYELAAAAVLESALLPLFPAPGK